MAVSFFIPELNREIDMRVALIQLTSTPSVADNIAACQSLTKKASKSGAQWILFPENAPFLGSDTEKLDVAQPLDGSIVQSYQELARDHRCWLTLGSFPEISPDPTRTYNTQVLINPDGEIHSVYRKIHLFDVEVEGGQTFFESKDVLSGEDVVTARIDSGSIVPDSSAPWVVGLSICYDLRFPELYRNLSAQGANVLTVPSAFTMQTGRDHWHPLLQARAIENQCYVLAPNQWGNHYGARYSYGNSAIYDPWGRRIACASEQQCVVLAELDLEYLQNVRRKMPVLTHQRIKDLT